MIITLTDEENAYCIAKTFSPIEDLLNKIKGDY